MSEEDLSDDASSSKKSTIIQRIFDSRFDAASGLIHDPLVTLVQIQSAIEVYNDSLRHGQKKLSPRNPANFFKDIKRSYAGFNRAWPKAVLSKGYTGLQVTGEGRCFRFVRLASDQTAASRPLYSSSMFQAGSAHYAQRLVVETLSLSVQERRLVRGDESHIAQVVAKLRVLERFMADCGDLELSSLQHLLNNAKLQEAEIDSLYAGTRLVGEDVVSVAVTCEVKGRAEDVFEDQIVRQVNMAPDLGLEFDEVVPIAVKLVAPSLICVIRFKTVPLDQARVTEILEFQELKLVELRPVLKGLG